MEISNTTNVQNTAQLTTSQTGTSAALASDFETFLKMLTAQARYQDPLEPIDSSEYAAQLAQFSMVEQQVLSNDLLNDLGSQLGASSIGQMASWIGMEGRTTSAVAFEGDPITILPNVDPGADEAVLVAYAADGSEVARQQISITGEALEWSGVLGDGSILPAGNYSFKVESLSLGKTVGVLPAETYARITEARRQGDDVVFVLNSGETVSSSDISALRESI